MFLTMWVQLHSASASLSPTSLLLHIIHVEPNFDSLHVTQTHFIQLSPLELVGDTPTPKMEQGYPHWQISAYIIFMIQNGLHIHLLYKSQGSHGAKVLNCTWCRHQYLAGRRGHRLKVLGTVSVVKYSSRSSAAETNLTCQSAQPLQRTWVTLIDQICWQIVCRSCMHCCYNLLLSWAKATLSTSTHLTHVLSSEQWSLQTEGMTFYWELMQ